MVTKTTVKKKSIKKAAPIKNIEAAPIINKYKNISKHNLFTEDGRCMADEIVNLTAEQASHYPALEIVI